MGRSFVVAEPDGLADDPRSPADLAVAGGHEQDLRDMSGDLVAD